MIIELTERERRIVGYALWRFGFEARENALKAAQKTTNFTPGAFEAFMKDSDDTEALRARVLAPNDPIPSQEGS